jgi:hypothetical protein
MDNLINIYNYNVEIQKLLYGIFKKDPSTH